MAAKIDGEFAKKRQRYNDERYKYKDFSTAGFWQYHLSSLHPRKEL